MYLRVGTGMGVRGRWSLLIHIANFLDINVNGYLTIIPTDEEEFPPPPRIGGSLWM